MEGEAAGGGRSHRRREELYQHCVGEERREGSIYAKGREERRKGSAPWRGSHRRREKSPEEGEAIGGGRSFIGATEGRIGGREGSIHAKGREERREDSMPWRGKLLEEGEATRGGRSSIDAIKGRRGRRALSIPKEGRRGERARHHGRGSHWRREKPPKEGEATEGERSFIIAMEGRRGERALSVLEEGRRGERGSHQRREKLDLSVL